MTKVLAVVFLGGGLGSLLRYLSVMGVNRVAGESFPYGTLFVNIVGSLLIGFIIEGFSNKYLVPVEIRAFLIAGVLGGFTTFSAFSQDVYRLIETGFVPSAVIYTAASVLLSIAAVFGGVYIARGIWG